MRLYLKIVKNPCYEQFLFLNVGNRIECNKTRRSMRKKRVMKRDREGEGMKR